MFWCLFAVERSLEPKTVRGAGFTGSIKFLVATISQGRKGEGLGDTDEEWRLGRGNGEGLKGAERDGQERIRWVGCVRILV